LATDSVHVNSKDNYNSRTPLAWAAGNGHEAVVKLLLVKGAKQDSKDSHSKTPLLLATLAGYEIVAGLLLAV
ncbi:hypothetical protein BKA65DRAFT_349234, partial [Rhexocercosporidium sp. MPI-PUGE-AT-0058]